MSEEGLVEDDYSGINRPRRWIAWLIIAAMAVPSGAAVWAYVS